MSVDESTQISIKLEVVSHLLEINSNPSGIPFTIDATTQTTPYSETLNEGTYTITMPSSIIMDDTTYPFKHWEDGSTNPTRTIDLVSDKTLTATYIEAPPIPNWVLALVAGTILIGTIVIIYELT